METNKVTGQRIKKAVEDNYSLAEKYYSILSVINDLHLTQRETQLMAFTAVRGNMSYVNVREEFCRKHETTFPTINNIISKLKKMGMLVKDKGKIRVNPAILLNFEEDIVLRISLPHVVKG